jgi:hypothetical protein
MANNKCSCSNGRTYLIDPNCIHGHDSTNNIFVPAEDLNIYVELTTSKKARSIIDITSSGVVGTSSERGSTRVSFIDGSDVGEGKKALTTSYTELTTVLNGENQSNENFGITSINIDFNSAYAPLIKIEFVDVKGSSLFNTDSGDGPKSQYSSFFDLPYPIFELKVKGYYGKTVKYCLHLTKWNARFNSSTGNFEISADFIGYTYALLTDMLLGYLRAIVKTPRGKVKFDEAKAEMNNPNELITISELLDRIDALNEELKKLSSDDVNVIELSANKKLITAINDIDTYIDETIGKLTKADDSSQSGYVQFKTGDLFAVKHDSGSSPTENEKTIITFKGSMETRVKNANEYITDGETKLVVSDYTNVKTKSNFQPFKLFDKAELASAEGRTYVSNFRKEFDLNDDVKYELFLESLPAKLKTSTSKLDIYNFTNIRQLVNTIKNSLDNSATVVKDEIGRTLQDTVIDIIGFEPTIKNIFRIFTVHSEIFLECLKDVSIEAETDSNKLRFAELKKLQNDFDIHKNGGQDLPVIYPWPLYRKPSNTDSKAKTLEEAWIGEDVDIPQNVPEIVFVEDLLKGLLKVSREDIQRQEKEGTDVIVDSWYPVNPLDTPLFGVVDNPYKTATIGNSNSRLEPLKLMMMRAFTFMGVSNRVLDDKTIQTMAKLEANAAFAGIVNKEIKDTLFDTGNEDIGTLADEVIKTFLDGNDGGKGNKLAIKTDDGDKYLGKEFMIERTFNGLDFYEYIFIWGSKDGKLIPMNGDFGGSEFYTPPNYIPNTIGAQNFDLFSKRYNVDTNEGLLMVSSNFGYNLDNVNSNSATNHGAIFMKIFTEDEYSTSKRLAPSFPNAPQLIEDLYSGIGFPSLSLNDLRKTPKLEEKLINGWRQFGDESIMPIPYNSVFTITYDSSDKLQSAISSGWEESGRAAAMFYLNVDHRGSTSLSSSGLPTLTITPTKIKIINGVEYYPTGSGIMASNKGDVGKFTSTDTNGKNRELYEPLKNNNSDVHIPYVDFAVDEKSFSLFGSQLYFEQRRSATPKASRAFLFLHTLPWNQIFTENGFNNGSGGALFDNEGSNIFPNLFGRRAAFISCPKLWVAWIGGLLWRLDDKNIIFKDDETSDYKDFSGKVPDGGGSGDFDPIIFGARIIGNPTSTNFASNFVPLVDGVAKTKFPRRDDYLTHGEAYFALHFSNDGEYKPIEKQLKDLPEQIKEEFKRAFFDFVQSSDWDDIREQFEIHDKDWDNPDNNISVAQPNGFATGTWVSGSNQWKTKWNIFYGSEPYALFREKSTGAQGNNIFITKSAIESYRNFEKFSSFTGLRQSPNNLIFDRITLNARYNHDISYKRDTEANKLLVNLFGENVVIANISYKPWVTVEDTQAKINSDAPARALNDAIAVPKPNLKTYISAFVEEFIKLNKNNSTSQKENDEKQTLFNTMDDDAIRLNIYRHCKTVYDKWIAGSGGNMLTSCGSNKKTVDKAVMLKDRTGDRTRLIDSFRFVNRAMNDISDDYIMNPNIIKRMIYDNPNQSFYDLISKVLSDNNFNFIALPAFIDYESPNEMSNLFRAEIHNDTLNDEVSGPTFVCVYVGQSSNKLDLGSGSDFPNDGFDFKCEDGQLVSGDGGLPLDFTKEKSDFEHNVVAFAVNYGQQNQNIFTDVRLDQQEFSETDESLQITDAISRNANQSNRTLAGQNLWNVYQVRSYSTEITAMGNAMIQPMMYFQLNNIPMFHGGYQIINVKHSIIPNHMKTTFKGVRTRFIDTPLVDSNTLYMSMLGTINVTTDGDGTPVTTTIDRARTSGPVPNTVDVNSLANTINDSVFDNIQSDKFIRYGNK